MGFRTEGGNRKWFGRCPECKVIYVGCRKDRECSHRDCSGFVRMVNLKAKATKRDVLILEEKIERLEQQLRGNSEPPKMIESVKDV